MSETLLLYGCLGSSVLLLLMMYLFKRGRTVLFFVAAYFVLFAFGPVINYLTGEPIYMGIRRENISHAALGFTLALSGLAVAQFVASRAQPNAQQGPVDALALPPHQRYFYSPVLLLLITYGVVGSATLLPVFLAGSKLASLQVSGPTHYMFLSVELAMVSTFFMTRIGTLERKLWLINTVVYVAYCLVTFERDFFFVLFSLFLHHQILQVRKRHLGRASLVGVLAAFAATGLFALRSGSGVRVSNVLNQGSVLFVDTYVMSIIPAHSGFLHGSTYLDALRNPFPSWLYDSGQLSLSEWLVRTYAPTSQSGYGFSLTAEAYLNFGFPGIFFVFLFVGLILAWLVNRFGRSDWTTYFSIYYVSVVMYAIRGDSQQILKSMIYGTLLFALVGFHAGDEVRSRHRFSLELPRGQGHCGSSDFR